MSEETMEIDETLPETVKKFLRLGYTLENIKLNAQGEWKHEGLDFENPRIIELFSRSIDRTEGGTWVLEVGRFTYPIEVEDVPLFVKTVHLDREPAQLELSDGSQEPLQVETLRYEGEGRLYCETERGWRARFLRGAYYLLAEAFVEEQGEIYFVHGGHRQRLHPAT